MTTSIRTSKEQDARLLDQKDKIKAIYEMLHDIPEEKSLFVDRIEGSDKETLCQDPSFLRWMAIRIQTRLRDANLELQEAMGRVADGVLDLSRKNFCDLTIKDFTAPLDGVYKVVLSGNFFRTLPPFLAHKPFITSIEAVGNLEDIEVQFHEYRRHNQVSLDLIETVRSLLEEDFENRDDYVALFEEITTNVSKLTIPEIGHKVNSFMEFHPIDSKKLEIHSRIQDGQKHGGVRGYISLEHFSNLELLDLSHCQLEHRSPVNWLSDLHHLQVLKLNDTPIKEIPISLKGKQLRILDISETQIRELPDWLGSMHSLKELYANDTLIASWPDSLAQLELAKCNLDHTYLPSFPKLHRLVKKVSICGTAIPSIPFEYLDFLQQGKIKIDDANCSSLRLQAKCAQNFYHKTVAHIVFKSELFINQPQCAPRAVKVQIVAIEYFTIISMLVVLQLASLIILPGPMLCSKRNGMKSTAFKDFKEQKAALGLSIYYLYFLFHLSPFHKLKKDTKTLSRFLIRR